MHFREIGDQAEFAIRGNPPGDFGELAKP